MVGCVTLFISRVAFIDEALVEYGQILGLPKEGHEIEADRLSIRSCDVIAF
jgi:hypothetical protein